MSVAFPPCPKCKASGCLNGGESLTHSHGEGCTLPCPDCGGRGVLITDELVEATARAIVETVMTATWPRPDDMANEVYRDDARSVLAAVLRHLKGTK